MHSAYMTYVTTIDHLIKTIQIWCNSSYTSIKHKKVFKTINGTRQIIPCGIDGSCITYIIPKYQNWLKSTTLIYCNVTSRIQKNRSILLPLLSSLQFLWWLMYSRTHCTKHKMTDSITICSQYSDSAEVQYVMFFIISFLNACCDNKCCTAYITCKKNHWQS